jgi:hypothetical protein
LAALAEPIQKTGSPEMKITPYLNFSDPAVHA